MTHRNLQLLVRFVDADTREVPRQVRVRRADEGADALLLVNGVVERVVANHHHRLHWNVEFPRLGAQLGCHLNRDLDCDRCDD